MRHRNHAALPLYVVLCALPLALPRVACADSLKGVADLTYGVSELKTSRPGGESSTLRSNSFTQNYSLSFDKLLYPNFKASGGGMFSILQNESTAGGVSTDTENTSLSPFADLFLATPFVQAQTGYRRRESNSQTNGIRTPKQVVESYIARIGLTPVELPTFNLTYSRQFAYDGERLARDVVQDSWSWSSNYTPRDGLYLKYAGNYSSQLDKISLVESENTTHSASVNYAQSVLAGRGNVSSSYSLTRQSTKASATGSAGIITTQVNASATSTGETSSATPGNTVTNGALTVDNNLLTGRAQVNIVLPLGSPPPAQTSERNFGLEFLQPVEINTIFLRVTSGTAEPSSLGDLAGSFAWSVYKGSDDGLTWTGVPATATFERDPSNPGSEDFGFVLRFASVSTRHIKAAVPLNQLTGVLPPPNADLSHINVTKVSGALTEQARTRESSTTSGSLNVNFGTQLLDLPAVGYTASASLTHSSGNSGGTAYLYSVTNGLSASHRFSEIFDGHARVGGEFSGGTDTDSAYSGTYSMGILATPLPTLGHSLVLSGRVQGSKGETETTQSLALTNTVQLYQGVSASVNGSYSTSSFAHGRKGESVVLNCGLNMTPHRTLTITTGYTEAITSQTDPEGERKTNNDSFDVGVSYIPFPQLFLSGSFGMTSDSNAPSKTYGSYSASWSPLPGGSLQATIVYSEGYTTSNDTTTRTFSPGLRWNIRPGSWLTLTYLLSSSDASDVSNEISTVSANLNVTY